MLCTLGTVITTVHVVKWYLLQVKTRNLNLCILWCDVPLCWLGVWVFLVGFWTGSGCATRVGDGLTKFLQIRKWRCKVTLWAGQAIGGRWQSISAGEVGLYAICSRLKVKVKVPERHSVARTGKVKVLERCTRTSCMISERYDQNRQATGWISRRLQLAAIPHRRTINEGANYFENWWSVEYTGGLAEYAK